mmetsp:Transcript_38282/g.58346  ORF Transcript_38282/g.58346 Transcript_38282/m.58346 type:complete len:108 (+) Transcript_38282:40-363(+)
MLINRNRGVAPVQSSAENDFIDQFQKDLNDIENINDRMERDIERKIQMRIQTYGTDGKKILGIHIKSAPRLTEPSYRKPRKEVLQSMDSNNSGGGMFITQIGKQPVA